LAALLTPPSITQLSQIISQITAPAFVLGAVAAFLSILITRFNRVVDRHRNLVGHLAQQTSPAHGEKAEFELLRQRARLLNRAILLSVISAIVTASLIIYGFVGAALKIQHEYGIAILFVVSLGFLTASLIELSREVRIALHEVGF
jgi:hypothetical protein